MLLRMDGELVAADAEGTILVGPDGPTARVGGPLARFSGERLATTGLRTPRVPPSP